jgi:vacuolar-type H+-ATPase subunit E/Vma4
VSIERLVEELDRQTEARVVELGQATRAEVARRAAEAERGRTERRATSTGALRLNSAVASATRRAEAAAEARRRVLLAHHALIDGAWAIATRGLDRSPPDRTWLAAAVERARAVVPPAPATVRCGPAAAAMLVDLLPAHWTVEVQADVGPGLIVTSDDGRISVDATAATHLARQRAQLARRVLAALGGAP